VELMVCHLYPLLIQIIIDSSQHVRAKQAMARHGYGICESIALRKFLCVQIVHARIKTCQAAEHPLTILK
jgi:hypothetical protein